MLILSENWVAYTHQDHPELRTPIPRREGQPESRGVLMVASAMHRQKDVLFYLLQSELGDLFKVRHANLHTSCGTRQRRAYLVNVRYPSLYHITR